MYRTRRLLRNDSDLFGRRSNDRNRMIVHRTEPVKVRVARVVLTNKALGADRNISFLLSAGTRKVVRASMINGNN